MSQITVLYLILLLADVQIAFLDILFNTIDVSGLLTTARYIQMMGDVKHASVVIHSPMDYVSVKAYQIVFYQVLQLVTVVSSDITEMMDIQ